MGKRADLKNLAYGLASGFISRNNDLDGYWAPGKLHALASVRGVNPFTLTLWPPSTPLADSPPSQLDTVPALQARYGAWLGRGLRRHRLDAHHLQSATIELDFDRGDLASHARTRGLVGAPPLVCRVTLLDDRGRVYRCEALGMCRPHDPARERRSTRAHPCLVLK